jgi:predicted SAM-dependent methyltransferase
MSGTGARLIRRAFDAMPGSLKPHLKRAAVPLIKLKSVLFRRAFPSLPDGALNLHLGCGWVNHPSFVNVDLLPASHVHYIHRIDRLPFISDGSVDLIHASHCLEHFSHRQVPSVLREWHRVLKKGGTLRLGVPDFDSIVALYKATGNDATSITGFLMGGQDYPHNFHMVVFNRDNLTRLLLEAGFESVSSWEPHSSELTRIVDATSTVEHHNGEAFHISLNLEARK